MIRRGQMAVLLLAVLLGIGVYLNASYGDSGGDFAITDTLETGSKVLGQAQAVASSVVKEPVTKTDAGEENAYFTQARLLRSQTRDESIELLDAIVKNAAADQGAKERAAEDMRTIAKAIEIEGRVEVLVRAKGFNECICYISESGVHIVIQSDGFDKLAATKVKDIVLAEMDISADKIKIVEMN